MKQYNRFDLEQAIMTAWNATESDIEGIGYMHFDNPDGPLSEDELMNALTGLKQNHNFRMQKVWDVFEQIIKDKSFDPPQVVSGQGTWAGGEEVPF